MFGGIRRHATRRAGQFEQAGDDAQLLDHPHQYAVAECFREQHVKTVVGVPMLGGLCFQRAESQNIAAQRLDRFRFDAADRELDGFAFEQLANLERLEDCLLYTSDAADE